MNPTISLIYSIFYLLRDSRIRVSFRNSRGALDQPARATVKELLKNRKP